MQLASWNIPVAVVLAGDRSFKVGLRFSRISPTKEVDIELLLVSADLGC
jgi:hypothetical protein